MISLAAQPPPIQTLNRVHHSKNKLCRAKSSGSSVLLRLVEHTLRLEQFYGCLFQPMCTLCTCHQLFVQYCTATWRHPGLSIVNQWELRNITCMNCIDQSQSSKFATDERTNERTKSFIERGCPRLNAWQGDPSENFQKWKFPILNQFVAFLSVVMLTNSLH
jgi:hypothetical protein